MFDRFVEFFRKRAASSFKADAIDWYQACQMVSDSFGKVLNDETIGHTEIGVTLDKVDRRLYGLRDSLHGLRGPLRQRNAALAKRVETVTERVFHLRNQATSFMIRSQGPTPRFLNNTDEAKDARWVHYYKAMEEKGFEARQIAREVADEIEAIWVEMQPLIGGADNADF